MRRIWPPPLGGIVTKLTDALEKLAERTLEVELLAAASLGRLRLTPEHVTMAELVAGLTDLGTVTGDVDAEVLVDPGHSGASSATCGGRPGWLPSRGGAARSPRTGGSARCATPNLSSSAVPPGPVRPFDRTEEQTGITIGLDLARALVVAPGGTLGIEQDDDGAVLWVRVPQRKR